MEGKKVGHLGAVRRGAHVSTFSGGARRKVDVAGQEEAKVSVVHGPTDASGLCHHGWLASNHNGVETRSLLVHLHEEITSNWGGGGEKSRWARGWGRSANS